jgi:GT2 family glycosyltransferase
VLARQNRGSMAGSAIRCQRPLPPSLDSAHRVLSIEAVTPAASIIVPTVGRPSYLEVTLDSIAPQAAGEDAEVIVVDDGPSSTIRSIALRRGARYIAHESREGANAARNTGIAAAQSDVLVFVDDDVEAPAGWLKALLAAAAEHEVVGGPIHARLEGTRLRHCGREGPPITWLDLGSADCPARFVWSANMAIHRLALDRVGWFDASLAWGDEYEWELRHKRAGGEVWYAADAGLTHRRAGRDARMAALSRAAYARGRHARQLNELVGTPPPLWAELRTLVGCVWHIARRACGNGVIVTAEAAGRVRETLARRWAADHRSRLTSSRPEGAAETARPVEGSVAGDQSPEHRAAQPRASGDRE